MTESRGQKLRTLGQEIRRAKEQLSSLESELQEAVLVSSKVSDAELRLKQAKQEVDEIEEELRGLKAGDGYRTGAEIRELSSIIEELKVFEVRGFASEMKLNYEDLALFLFCIGH